MIRKFAVVIVLLGLLLLGGAFYLKSQFPSLSGLLLDEPKQEIFSFDQSLIASDMLMLAHFDQTMLDEISSQAVALSLQQLQAYAGVPFRALSTSLLATQQHADSWTFSAYLGADNAPTSLVVMRGDFDSSALLKSLETDYKLYTRMLGEIAVYDLERLDERGCELHGGLSLYVGPGYVIAADVLLMDRMLPLIVSGFHGGEVLQDWRLFSSNKLTSIWINRPAMLKESKLTRGALLDRLITTADAYASNFTHVFLGIGVDVFEREGIFSLQGKSENERFAAFSVAKWQAYMTQKSESLRLKLPSVYALLEPMLITNEQAVVAGQRNFESTLFSSLPLTIVELTEFIFATSEPNQLRLNTRTNDIDKEYEQVLDIVPRRYFTGFKHANLKVYNVDLLGVADGVSGPFGLRVASASLDEDSGQVAVTFDVSGRVDNLGDQAVRVRFFLGALTDKNGNNVMQEPHCNAEARRGVPFVVDDNDRVRATQTVLLKQGVRFEDLKHVKAQVEVNLPQQVKRQHMDLPSRFPNKIDLSGDIILTLHAVEGGYLSYSVSGQVADLLEVRALNQAGDILKRKTLQQEYQYGATANIDRSEAYGIFLGKIEGLELVVASGDLKQGYTFDIALGTSRGGNLSRHLKREPKLYLKDDALFHKSNLSRACLQGRVLAGPFCLGVPTRVPDGEGYVVNISAPQSAYIKHSISRLSLHIMQSAPENDEHAYWPIFLDEGPGLSADMHLANLQSNNEQVRGRLTVREAASAEVITMDGLRLGQTVGNSHFQAKLIALDAQGNYTLRVAKGLERLLMLVGRDNLWRPLSTRVTVVEPDLQGGQARVGFNVSGAGRLDLFIAEEQVETTYEVNLPY